MRILVTGGAGFIGSHLCTALLEQGHTVICADNLVTGSKRNIKALQDNKNFSFIEHDVTEPLSLPGPVDRVYNLACPASPVAYQADPNRTLLTNTQGTYMILLFAQKKNARFLQASTSEVYGDPLVHPQREDYLGNVNPHGLRSCYDEGKRAAESFVMNFHRLGVSTRIVRIFNTYGPNMSENDGRVVSNFITQALTGKPLTIYGSGSQTRSLCYVEDLIRGLVIVMESDEHEPVNLGNPDEETITELAQEIIKLTRSKSKVVHEPLPSDDPRKRKPDITRAEGLGWTPRIKRAEGLTRTVAYFTSVSQKK